MAKVEYSAVGRRKSAIARVRLVAGDGKIVVNKRDLDSYFGLETLKMTVRQPLELTKAGGDMDILVTVTGGGLSGQAGAIRHGVSRALIKADPELRDSLKKAGFLTRDPAHEGAQEVRPESRKARAAVLQALNTQSNRGSCLLSGGSLLSLFEKGAMRMPICYLIGAGAFTVRDLYPKSGDFVIAADDGYSSLRTAGLSPDLLVGDFDSLREIPQDIPRKTYVPQKNDTDLALALQEGAARGYRTFCFYGASGGREDHAFANLQLLGGASRQGFSCKMVCPSCDVHAVTDGTLTLPNLKARVTVSVFCHGDCAEGVTLQGFQYPLQDAELTCNRPLGVSNEANGGKASVTVKSGTLLVFVML